MKLTNEHKVVLIVLSVFLATHFAHWYFLSRDKARVVSALQSTIEQLQHDKSLLQETLRPKCPGDSLGR